MDINFIAVIVSGVLSMVLGFIWYGPLFAKLWMRENKFSAEDVGNGPGVGYLLTFIASMVTAAVTSLLVHRLGVTQVIDGAALGLLLGVGFVATTFLTNYIFSQKSFKLYAIDAGYQVIYILIASVVTTLIR